MSTPWQQELDALKRRAVLRSEEGRPEAVTLVVRGWYLMLSCSRPPTHWCLSAMLHPPGRGSNEADWRFLGHIVKYLGAPHDPTDGFPDDANAPVHWEWVEPAAEPPTPAAA